MKNKRKNGRASERADRDPGFYGRDGGWNEHFAFIAGFTEGGFSFGVTWEEMRRFEDAARARAEEREARPMRTIRVDMNDLEMAFESRGGETAYYLDTETGRCVAIPFDGFAFGIADEDDDPEFDRIREMIDDAPPGRFILLDTEADLRPSYGDAREFIEGVEDRHLRQRMTTAINQRRRAFRRFLDLVYSEVGEADRWNYFSRQRLRENIARFLQSEKIDIICDPLPPFKPRFRTREHLLEASANFVERAKVIQGVLRIALIGSMLTPKREPNGIDLLLTIGENADVAAIAAAARKLKRTRGKHQSWSPRPSCAP